MSNKDEALKWAEKLGETIAGITNDNKALIKVESERIDNLWRAINAIEVQIDKVQADLDSSILNHHKRIEVLERHIVERQDKTWLPEDKPDDGLCEHVLIGIGDVRYRFAGGAERHMFDKRYDFCPLCGTRLT